ncbi:CSL family zinc fnger-containing protein [Aspergillus luchuensis]|uniref:Diphthamide biosynthesis protein 3 n=1 Tax=Aspergillus kawachii TaxID=1069201 RepID=A0A7R8A022_ASPKA|nr:diphthamide biosynthesis protein 3 [Aspergillus luchuensis]BCS01239.1 diphthamide biosynthesis protein 3 [Aspergillus luchuensis]
MADDSISIYDEIEIEDMAFDPVLQIYHYPCPCGDRFEIAIDDLRDGEDIGVCPSCSLMIRVIFDAVIFPSFFLSFPFPSCFLRIRYCIIGNCDADDAGFASRPIFPRTVMIRTGRRLLLFRLKCWELSLRVKPIQLI